MPQPGEVFAGYTVERQLGAGGMGEVYVARACVTAAIVGRRAPSTPAS